MYIPKSLVPIISVIDKLTKIHNIWILAYKILAGYVQSYEYYPKNSCWLFKPDILSGFRQSSKNNSLPVLLERYRFHKQTGQFVSHPTKAVWPYLSERMEKKVGKMFTRFQFKVWEKCLICFSGKRAKNSFMP